MVNPRDIAWERKKTKQNKTTTTTNKKNQQKTTEVRAEYVINTGNKYKHWKQI